MKIIFWKEWIEIKFLQAQLSIVLKYLQLKISTFINIIFVNTLIDKYSICFML